MAEVVSSEERYKQYCEDLRFYGDMRFKQLSLWSVGSGFLLKLYFDVGSNASKVRHNLWIVIFLWTAVIWIMEVRSSVHGALRIEMKRPFEPILTKGELRNRWTLVNATNAVALLYAGVNGWCTAQLLLQEGYRPVVVWLVMIGFLFLIVFTIREYWPMWGHAIRSWSF